MTIGSLFAGVGGLELGLEWAGLGPVLWQVEREPVTDLLRRHRESMRLSPEIREALAKQRAKMAELARLRRETASRGVEFYR